MDYTPVSLGTQSNPGRTAQAGDARLINCYVEGAGPEGKSQWPIYASSGFTAFSTLATSGVAAIRGMFTLSSLALYVVSGTKLCKVSAAGSETNITATLPASGLVTMARNRKEPNAQIGISVGGEFWICENDVATEIDLAPLASTTLTSVAALDGYFLLLFDNGEFFVSSIDDSTIDPLDFAKAESSPDAGVVVKIRGREAVLFGEQSTEYWTNTGAADFPFERASSANFGCWAAGSAVNIGDTIVFAATDADGAYAGISMLDGYSARKVSTLYVDRALVAETDKTTIKAFSWSLSGHTFYAISTSTATHVYDMSTGQWHERTSSGLAFWRVACACSFGTKVIVGDYTLSKLYWLKEGLYDAGTASVLTLKHSNNAGTAWNATRTASLNTADGSGNSIRVNRLGQSKENGKLFQLSISNAVMEDGTGNAMTVQPPTVHAYPRRVRFYGAAVDVTAGSSQGAVPKGLLGFAVAQRVLA